MENDECCGGVRVEGESRLRAFAGFYLGLCTALAGIGFWNSERLMARADMLAEPARSWSQAGLDTMASEGARARLGAIQKVLLMGFEAPALLLAQREPGLAVGAEPAAASVARAKVGAGGAGTGAGSGGAMSMVFFAGDSLANGYAAGGSAALVKAKSSVKARDYGKVSTGLVSKSYFDWSARVAELCKSKPSAFVFSFGSNDPMDMREGAVFVKFGSAAWREAYGSRAAGVVAAAHACGAKAVWLNLPPMRAQAMSGNAKIIRAAQERACSEADACVDPFSDLAEPLGKEFAEYGSIDGKRRLLRAQDGVHMAPEGYLTVARQALEALGVEVSAP